MTLRNTKKIVAKVANFLPIGPPKFNLSVQSTQRLELESLICDPTVSLGHGRQRGKARNDVTSCTGNGNCRRASSIAETESRWSIFSFRVYFKYVL